MASILLRETVVGAVLYAILGKDAGINAALCVLTWTTLVLVSRRYGLLKHRSGLDLVTECTLVFCGAAMFCNILFILTALLADPH